ncbi:hypothetical protein AB3M80_13310 [Arthrospira platensis BEA 1257B]
MMIFCRERMRTGDKDWRSHPRNPTTQKCDRLMITVRVSVAR